MAPLGTVLSLALLSLAWSAAQFGNRRHHSTFRQPTVTRFAAPQTNTRFAAPRVTTATTANFHRPAAQTFRVSSPSFQNGAQTFRTSAPSHRSNAHTFRTSAPSFQNNARTFQSSAPSSFKSSAPSSFKSSAPSSFQSSVPSSFQSSAPSSFKSSAPSSFKNSAPSSFQSSAPPFQSSAPPVQSSVPSFQSSAPPVQSSVPSFQSSVPSSPGRKQSFVGSGSSGSRGSSGPKLVGRQRLAAPSTRGQSFNSRQHSANQQGVRQAIRGSTKYYVSWTSGSHRTYTWDEADHECRRFGLRLISLTSFEKEAEISKLLNDAPFPVSDYWTSATKQGPDGDFMWGDRKSTPVCRSNSHAKRCHQNWSHTGQNRVGQPDNAEGQENCLAVKNRSYPGDGITWHDTPCHRAKHFVCEPY